MRSLPQDEELAVGHGVEHLHLTPRILMRRPPAFKRVAHLERVEEPRLGSSERAFYAREIVHILRQACFSRHFEGLCPGHGIVLEDPGV